MFTIQNAQAVIGDLTYRKINDWDSKSLISCSRENEDAGWRKFSVIDLVKLNIISHLKKFGFTTESIKIIVDKLSSGAKVPAGYKSKETKTTSSQLEIYTLACFRGEKMLLLIEEDTKAFFLTEKEFVVYNFFLDENPSPLLILPFFSFIQETLTRSVNFSININKNSLVKGLLEASLSDREKKILEIVRDKAYQEITITKQNGDEMIIKPKSRRQGDFSDKDIIGIINAKAYQNVTVSTVGGKKIILVNEERIKV